MSAKIGMRTHALGHNPREFAIVNGKMRVFLSRVKNEQADSEWGLSTGEKDELLYIHPLGKTLVGSFSDKPLGLGAGVG